MSIYVARFRETVTHNFNAFSCHSEVKTIVVTALNSLYSGHPYLQVCALTKIAET